MKPEAVPYWGFLVALLLGGVYLWQNFDMVKFDEPEGRQMCRPQIEKDGNRWGRRTHRLEVTDLQPNELVRFKVKRTRAWVVTARVVAREGERVKIEAGKVFVNGKEIKDEYVRAKSETDYFPELIVPAGCVFVLNDARHRFGADRLDSRGFGPIPLRAITHRFGPKERLVKGRKLR